MTAQMREFETLSRRVVLERGKYLTVEDRRVRLPDGSIEPRWPWVVTPDFAVVLPITEHGDFLCFRQVKYGIEGVTLATVGGYLEPGEDPLEGARRELKEETGCVADDWVELGRFIVDGNRGAGTAHLFLAGKARKVAAVNADDVEEQQPLYLDRAELEEALIRGEFKSLSWTALVALALQYLRRPRNPDSLSSSPETE